VSRLGVGRDWAKPDVSGFAQSYNLIAEPAGFASKNTPEFPLAGKTKDWRIDY